MKFSGLVGSLLALALISGALIWEPGNAGTLVRAPTVTTFFDSGQSLGNQTSQGVALADLNGNGHLDAFVANVGPNRVWFNDGSGFFSASGQAMGNSASHGVALGDLNGDGYLDAFVANSNGPDRVWFNNGAGQFTDSGQMLGNSASHGVALGDLNGNGHLDAFVANNGGPNRVWFNNGNGMFTDSGQALGTFNSYGVALADLDGDGDLDAFVANGLSGAQPDTVWLNDGSGVFTDSGQRLGGAWSYEVALADLNGNGRIDAFTASWFPAGNKVWLNNGSGVFSDSGQTLGAAAAIGVALGDLDGDGDLDAALANNTPDAVQLWLNNGNGAFSFSGQTLGSATTYAVALGDLDGDGDLDIFAANFGPNRVWFNQDTSLPTARFDVERQANEAGRDVTYWARQGDAMLPIMLNRAPAQAIAVHTRVESAAGDAVEIIPFAVGERIQYITLANPQPDPSTTITLTLSVTLPGAVPAPEDVTDRLLLIFVDHDQGLHECILCYVEWLARFAGFNPTFGVLHHVDLADRESDPIWIYYTGLFDLYSPEMARIVATHPSLLWLSLRTLEQWAPAAQSLSSGAEFVISEEMAASSLELLEGIQTRAGPGLDAAITREQEALDLASFAGLDVQNAWDELVLRRSVTQTFIPIMYRSDQ